MCNTHVFITTVSFDMGESSGGAVSPSCRHDLVARVFGEYVIRFWCLMMNFVLEDPPSCGYARVSAYTQSAYGNLCSFCLGARRTLTAVCLCI